MPIIYAQYLYWYWYFKVMYWYWYWYLKIRYWYLYWYLDHWYWYWYWYLFDEYLIQDCRTVHCFQYIWFHKRMHLNEHRNGYWLATSHLSACGLCSQSRSCCLW